MSGPTMAEVQAQLTAPGQPFEIDEIDVRGERTRVWKNAPPSLSAILELSLAHGDNDFLVYEDEHYSFARHHRLVSRLASELVERFGVRKGDRVAIAMRNFPEWSVAFWAAAAVGAVVVPLNAWWEAAELAYGLSDSGAVLLVADADRLDRLADRIAALPALRTLIVVRDERAEPPAGALHFDAVVAEHDEEMAAGRETPLPEVKLDPEDDATIFYTSGTTGNPKGVLGTQRNICTNLVSLGFGAVRGAIRSGATKSDGPSGPTAYLLSVPFFHATGCHSVLVANLAAGNKLVLMHKWDPTRALELIERERITTFGGVPAMVWQVIEHPNFAAYDVSSLKSVGYGGAPAAPELVRRIGEMFPGRSPSNGYGLTETSSVTTLNAGIDYVEHPDSVGVPVPVCDVKVVDPDGSTLPIGEIGELWIKGPNVVKGYFNKPAATAETFTDGWLHSGDVARLDAEGFVYIVDRQKDLVIRGGENISSVEVESALFEHPAVTDAAVIGVAHPVLGEEVGAVVQLAPGASVSPDDLRAHLEGRIAGFKVPTHIWFLAGPLPRNAAGKTLKRNLKDHVAGHEDGTTLAALPEPD